MKIIMNDGAFKSFKKKNAYKTFSPDGTLYISNESGKASASIIQVNFN